MDYLNGDGSQPLWSPDGSASADHKQDPYGEEMGENAHIWRVYAKVAKDADKEMVEWWNRGLDNLAVFAGLFSAATIAFIIEVYKDMKRDFTELTFRAMTTNASYAQTLDENFIVPSSARLVNSLWISSLLLSLSAAMIAMMGKDWIASYGLADRSNVRDWALLRQHRLDSVLRWKMAWLIASAPHLLHCALGLFVTGLVVLIYPLDPHTGVVASTLTGVIVFVYIGLKVSTIVSRDSPFRSLGFSAAYPPRTSASQRDVATLLRLSNLESFLESTSRSLYDPLNRRELLLVKMYRINPVMQMISGYLSLWPRAFRAVIRATRSKSPWTHVPATAPISWWSNALNWLYATGQPHDTVHAIRRAVADLTYGASVFSELRPELQDGVLGEHHADKYATYHLRTTANASLAAKIPAPNAKIRLYRDSGVEHAEDALISLGLLGEGPQLDTSEGVRELCSRNSSVRIHAATVKGLLLRIMSPPTTDPLADSHVKALCILNTWKDAFDAAPGEMMRALRDTLPATLHIPWTRPPPPRPSLETKFRKFLELYMLLVFPPLWPIVALSITVLASLYEIVRSGGIPRISLPADTTVLKAVGLYIAGELIQRLRYLGILPPSLRHTYPYECTEANDYCQLIQLLVAVVRDENKVLSLEPNALADAVDLLVHASSLHPHDPTIAHIDVSLALGRDYAPRSVNALGQRSVCARAWRASEVSAVLRLTPGLYGLPTLGQAYCDAEEVWAYLTPAIVITMVLDPNQRWYQSPVGRDALVDCCSSLSRRFQVSTTNLQGLDAECCDLLQHLLSGATLNALSAAPRSTFVQLLTRIALFLGAVEDRYPDRTRIFAEFAASSLKDPDDDSKVLREWSLLSSLPDIVRDCMRYSAEIEDVRKLLVALPFLRLIEGYNDASYWRQLATAVCEACADMRYITSVDEMLTAFRRNMG